MEKRGDYQSDTPHSRLGGRCWQNKLLSGDVLYSECGNNMNPTGAPLCCVSVCLLHNADNGTMRLLVGLHLEIQFASSVNPQVADAVHQSSYERTSELSEGHTTHTSCFPWQMESIVPTAGMALGSQGNCVINPHDLPH